MRQAPATVPVHLAAFLDRHRLETDFLTAGVPMPTVPSAAAAIGVPEAEILKTLLFTASDGSFVIAIANGPRRISPRLLGRAAGLERLRPASPERVQDITGYPAGGVAPFALPDNIPVVVDVGVSTLPVAYAGGGSEEILLRVRPDDVIRLNRAKVAQITESS